MENKEKIKMLGALIENELNGGCLGSQSGQLDLVAKSTQFHRYLQSEFGSLLINFIKFHAFVHSEESGLSNRFYDDRNEWIGEFCERLWRVGILDIWSGDENAIKDAIERQFKEFFGDNRFAHLKCERIAEMMEG